VAGVVELVEVELFSIMALQNVVEFIINGMAYV
jgi:hypothetical protein